MGNRALCLATLAAVAAAPATAFAAAPAAQRADTIVRVAGAPLHAGGATLELELTIGSGDVAEEYQFARVTDLFPARDGSIWILHGTAVRGQVARFDSTGLHLRNVGRNGSGPGEYRAANGIAQLPDGRLVVRDVYHANRLSIFTPDGLYDTTWTYAASYMGPTNLGIDTSGTVWVWHSRGLWDLRWGAARIRDGTIMDSVAVPTLAPDDATETFDRVRARYSAVGPFRPAWRHAWSPDGYFATTFTATYAIDLRKPRVARAGSMLPAWHNGDPVLRIRRDVEPVVVSDQERGDRQAYLVAEARARIGEPTRNIPSVPRTKPPIWGVRFDEDGRLWVSVAVPSERFNPPRAERRDGRPAVQPLRWREPLVFDVYESDGRYVGRARGPYVSECSRMRMRGDRVWCAGSDSDGAAVVRRYRIVWK